MEIIKILVSGANGQVGKCLQDIQHHFPEVRFFFMGRDNFALEQYAMVNEVLKTLKPDVVINAAAYTAVDKAEAHADLAFLINGEAVGHLAEACEGLGIRLIHISTDYVFDGRKGTPYHEEDTTHPLGVYGASKLMGEQLALSRCPNAMVVRTAWVYSRHGQNFVKTMLRLMREKESIGVVADQWGCPTWAQDLAGALVTMATQHSNHSGIYHYTNSGLTTWFDFASAIRDQIQSPCQVNAITTADYPTPAKRPAYSVLDCSRIVRDFSVTIRPWQDSLQECLSGIMTEE